MTPSEPAVVRSALLRQALAGPAVDGADTSVTSGNIQLYAQSGQWSKSFL